MSSISEILLLQRIDDKLGGIADTLHHIHHLIKQMTIDDSVVQQLIDAITAALAAEATDAAAVAAANATIATLQSQLAPNPTLLAAAQTAIQNALAANPPATPPPTPAPTPATS
jgi:ABC-type transporter Mla subunit MlaD